MEVQIILRPDKPEGRENEEYISEDVYDVLVTTN